MPARPKMKTFWVLRAIVTRKSHALDRYHRDLSCSYIHHKENMMEIKALDPGAGNVLVHRFDMPDGGWNTAGMRPCARCGS